MQYPEGSLPCRFDSVVDQDGVVSLVEITLTILEQLREPERGRLPRETESGDMHGCTAPWSPPNATAWKSVRRRHVYLHEKKHAPPDGDADGACTRLGTKVGDDKSDELGLSDGVHADSRTVA